MKEGRLRQFLPIGGIDLELDHLDELRARAVDLIEDIPAASRSIERIGHTLAGLMQHMCWAEAKWITAIDGSEDVPDGLDAAALAPWTRAAVVGLTLETPFHGPRFGDLGQVLRHLQWHWSYHAAQMGLLRRELGFRYRWR